MTTREGDDEFWPSDFTGPVDQPLQPEAASEEPPTPVATAVHDEPPVTSSAAEPPPRVDDAAPEATPDLDDDRRPPAARRRRWAALLAVVGALAIVAVVAAVFFRNDAADLRSERDERREVAERAGRFTELLLSYSFTDLAANNAAVLELATDSFAATYEEAFVGGLDAVITELEATAEASVRDVWVGELGEERASAIVQVDSTIEASSGLRRLVGSYLRLEFVLEEGEWNVDQVTHLVADDESVVPPVGEEDPATTESTAVPPAGSASEPPATSDPPTTAG